MEKLPTAEEICHKYISFWQPLKGYEAPLPIKNAMIEFAKLHVEAALKAAYDNIEYTTVDSSVPYVVEGSILNSYPLTNIK